MTTQNTIFEPLEAALFLGITPELLFSYARNAPKSVDSGRKLKTIDHDGRTGFYKDDLEQFDEFLRAPWAGSDDPRPKIPEYVDTYLKIECGGQCARCGEGFPLENAHIVDYVVSLSHHHHNLIRICSSCHKKFDRKILPKEQLVELKRKLISDVKTRIERKLSYKIPRARVVPVPVRHFVGRQEEVADLGKALLTDRVIAIQGTGGCGKTELLVQALARYVDQREVIWIEVDSAIGPQAVEMALRTALSSAGATNQHSLASDLDNFGGYVVLDGVERAEVGADFTFEDTIIDLIEATEKVRFILTSQVSFSDINIDHRLQVRSLSSEASQSILTVNWFPSCATDTTALTYLEQFADGHPLTLRILNALLRHFEKADIVANRLSKHGASAVSHPVRKTPNSETSLERCLSTAFALLDEDAKRVMYIASYLPAGFFDTLIDSEKFVINDPESAIATLRRWNLLDVIWRARDVRRFRALSPIRAFFRYRYANETPELTRELTFELVRFLTVHAMMMDDIYFSTGDLAVGAERFSEELPNILEALETARHEMTTEPRYLEWIPRISTSLQRYFFISGSSAQSVHIFDVGLSAALQEENNSKACTLAMHLLINGQRLDDHDLRDRAISTLRAISSKTDNPEVLAQRAIAESMVALEKRRLKDARQWAQTAVDELRTCLGKPDNDNAKHLRHLLSMALMALGRADEETGQFGSALSVFEESLEMMAENNDFLNTGTIHHQIANCHAGLRQYHKATSHYLRAVKLFHVGQIREHIGNSLSELGHLLIEYENGTDTVSRVVVVDALQFGAEDVFSSIEWACRNRPSIDNRRGLTALRRLIGFCMLLSFIRQENALEDICQLIRSELIVPLSERYGPDAGSDPTIPPDEKIFAMALDVSIAVAGYLASIQTSEVSLLSTENIFLVAQYCHMVEIGTCKRYGMFDWFAGYLRLRCRFSMLTSDLLREAYLQSNGDVSKFKLSGYDSLLDI